MKRVIVVTGKAPTRRDPMARELLTDPKYQPKRTPSKREWLDKQATKHKGKTST